jgi:hypothetical protein
MTTRRYPYLVRGSSPGLDGSDIVRRTMDGRTARTAWFLAATIGGVLGAALFDRLSGDSLIGYVLAAIGGAAAGLIIGAMLLRFVVEVGELTGLSDEESRFPRIRKFFDSFTFPNEP